MNERKSDTVQIKTKQGPVEYAKVSSRLSELHKDNVTCDIVTAYEFKDGWCLFVATVTTKKGTYTGHSIDKIDGKQKQFEKQESIAVGRALAFAGYLSDGSIASYEEMADVVTTAQLNSLKLKYSKEYADSMSKLDRPAKQRAFDKWAIGIIGEEVNYQDAGSWCREWYDECWRSLGVSSDVPFSE